MKVISRTSFQLQLPLSWKVHPVFHASLLTPYRETREHGNNSPEPPPDLIDGQPEWEVEQILGIRRRRNQLQYLIRWKGFSEAHDSWEPLTHINADSLIEDFHQKNPTASRTTRTHKNPNDPNQTPNIICCVNMSTHSTSPTPSSWAPEETPIGLLYRYVGTPLQSRIDNPPPALTLAERLSDPEDSKSVSPQTQGSYCSLEEGAPDLEERGPSSPIPELPLPPSSTFTELSEPCKVLVNRALHPESSFDPPDGYVVYDRTIASHVNYGAKIHLTDD